MFFDEFLWWLNMDGLVFDIVVFELGKLLSIFCIKESGEGACIGLFGSLFEELRE